MCCHHQVETFYAVYSWCYNLVKIKDELRSVRYCKSSGQPVLHCIAFRNPGKLKNNKKHHQRFLKTPYHHFLITKFSQRSHWKFAECIIQDKNSKATGVQPLHSKVRTPHCPSPCPGCHLDLLAVSGPYFWPENDDGIFFSEKFFPFPGYKGRKVHFFSFPLCSRMMKCSFQLSCPVSHQQSLSGFVLCCTPVQQPREELPGSYSEGEITLTAAHLQPATKAMLGQAPFPSNLALPHT